MKKLLLIALVASTLVFTGCFKDDDTPIIIEETTIIQNPGGGTGEECPVIAVTGEIADGTVWTNDNIYQLNQKVVVPSGATLTNLFSGIDPGDIPNGTIIQKQGYSARYNNFGSSFQFWTGEVDLLAELEDNGTMIKVYVPPGTIGDGLTIKTN